MVWYGMVWYGMVWYVVVWYGLVWYGMACHDMVQWHNKLVIVCCGTIAHGSVSYNKVDQTGTLLLPNKHQLMRGYSYIKVFT